MIHPPWTFAGEGFVYLVIQQAPTGRVHFPLAPGHGLAGVVRGGGGLKCKSPADALGSLLLARGRVDLPVVIRDR